MNTATTHVQCPVGILIAEDSPTQSEKLAFILRRHGFQVTTTRNGWEALESMQASKPSLVITDVNMPEMDGYELCRRIRTDQQFVDIPVILLTSLSDPEDVFRGLECGADNFITKPYDENHLLSRIEYLLANIHLRTPETMQIEMEVFVSGQRHYITSSRAQILNLLLSTYEAAVQKNRELAQAHQALTQMNGQLEEKVVERTASLTSEIEERKRAMEKIAEQAALLDQTQDAVSVRDLEGCISFWNKGAERIYGWTYDEAVGRNAGDFLYADKIMFEKINANTIQKGEWSGELQVLTKDRSLRTIVARWTLLRDAEGHPKSVLAIGTDITEKKKIEAQFMRAQRMESIGTLAGGIAHDLNNILAPIMMSIGLLKLTVTDPQNETILKTIEVSAKRGSDIVRQVLSFARGLEGQRIEVQPKHLLKDIESILKDTFPKNIRLNVSVPNDTWTLLGDPTQLHQILLNLCVNARDAMPQGGDININAENRVLDEQYVAMNAQAKAGSHVIISVVDSGTGIPSGVLDKIFDPFFTTKEVGKGTGLGLSTVLAIAKSHGGFITVYSEPGRGTTFKVYLPATPLPEGGSSPANEASLPRGKGETILLVDDEASILTITSQTLEAFGYRVLTAADGAMAVAIYAQHRDKIAVVLTDMAMPLMDGAATIRALTSINSGVKIIAASGLDANNGAAKASNADIKYFVTKPYTAETLLKTLREILDKTNLLPKMEDNG